MAHQRTLRMKHNKMIDDRKKARKEKAQRITTIFASNVEKGNTANTNLQGYVKTEEGYEKAVA